MKTNKFYFSLAVLFFSFSSLMQVYAGDTKKTIELSIPYFTDATCSELKAGFKAKDLKKIKNPDLRLLAKGLLDKTYDKTYRAASYKAYASVQALAEDLKLGNGFSQYENITGMYLEQGEAIILVGNTEGKSISLLVPELMRKPAQGIEPTKDPNGWGLKKQEIELHEGVNIVNILKAGNAYISYFDNNPKTASPIKVHFISGKVNGFFDSSIHSNSDWNSLLDNAISPIMDARGKYIQVAYPVEYFKEFTYNQGTELIGNYDKMLHEQYSLMGLVKYNKIPDNRILARVNFNYYMFRDKDGVAYLGDKGTMNMVANPNVVISGDPCWGFCHEVGHVLQMPQITWGGMTEVSNNIFSLYTSAAMGNKSRLKEQDNYAKARASIIESSPKISYLQDPDVFNRLVPFWQLQLYFSKNGQADFYADVMEQMRNQPMAGKGNESIMNMFDFIKIACDVTKIDLTDFFDQWGFFYIGNIELDDYAKYNFTITQKEIDETKTYIASKKYSTPKTDITLEKE